MHETENQRENEKNPFCHKMYQKRWITLLSFDSPHITHSGFRFDSFSDLFYFYIIIYMRTIIRSYEKYYVRIKFQLKFVWEENSGTEIAIWLLSRARARSQTNFTTSQLKIWENPNEYTHKCTPPHFKCSQLECRLSIIFLSGFFFCLLFFVAFFSSFFIYYVSLIAINTSNSNKLVNSI